MTVPTDATKRRTPPSCGGGVAFSEFAGRWLAEYAAVSVKPSTHATYRSIVGNSLAPFFGRTALEEIRTEQVQRFVASRVRDGLSANTVGKHLALLKIILRHAVEWGYLEENPATPVRGPRVPYREVDVLEPAEARRLLAHLDDGHRVLFATALLTGMRLGELLALKWRDVDLAAATLRVRRSLWRGRFLDPKTRHSVRTIPLTPSLVASLERHRRSRLPTRSDLVFATREGTPLDPDNLRKRVFEPARDRAGLSANVRIADCRHFYASLLIAQGENLKYVQRRLGHASITTTVDRYGHLFAGAHDGVRERLDASLFGDVQPALPPEAAVDDGWIDAASQTRRDARTAALIAREVVG
jgi:integrase